FLYSNGQLYYSTDGTQITATTGILARDSLRAMDYLSESTVLAASAINLYLSTDGGSEWRTVATGLGSCRSIFADRSHGVVFVGGDSIWRSIDSGLHWATVPTPPPFGWTIHGFVTGSHDCVGALYVTDNSGLDFNNLRSLDQA